MQTFVVSLQSAQDRRQNITEQFSRNGVDFSFFDAIGPESALEYFDGIDSWLCLMEMDRQPTPGEIGCYASHKALWQKCVALGEPVLIAEDDISLTSNFGSSLQIVIREIDNYGFLRLEELEEGWHWWDCGRPHTVANIGESKIQYQTTPSLRTSAYAITPSAAGRLLQASDKMTCAVDHFFRRNWSHRQPLFFLTPPLASLSEHSEVETITGRETVKRPYIVRRTRKIYKYYARWRQNKFNKIVARDYF